MPEGHVIHRLAEKLDARFGGTPVEVSSPQGRFSREAAELSGSTFDGAEAWGKHLFLRFAEERIVHIHLGLIGTFRIQPFAEPKGQVRLRIADTGHQLAADLHGPQWCRLITPPEMEGVIAKQGADPLRGDANPAGTFAAVQRSRRGVGSLLMDQKLFAGVGNIYRAETLFRLGISPALPGNQLTDEQLHAIWADLVELMAAGKAAGRIDTVRPEHTPEAMHRPPRKDDHGGEVYVYRRTGLPCLVCGTPIAQRILDGRNLFWCPGCQGGIA
ncbi:DNA glycosylase [Corynebacterium atypicum]|uniref:DNA-(apurinic or apyrimidinic site) lyase n=1 Tax=Corynebacterium atypicum TaxID=191610 RepID=A0ABM5QQV5_9CORY|nr:DNA-formamidopyrimidine glycosylase family protein [Corynebacterium atypicum]AIG64865.1 DNA glycosylase [Corynebacterium atypicum]